MLNKRAFVLLEVVLALFIMGILYSVVITAFSKNSIKNKEVYNLKKSLLSYKQNKDSTIKLIVFETKAYIQESGVEEYKTFTIPKGTKFHTYDLKGKEPKKGIYDLESKRYNDEVLFVYTIYPNQSSTPIVMELAGKYYTYETFYEDVKIFDNLELAKRYLLQTELKVGMAEAK